MLTDRSNEVTVRCAPRWGLSFGYLKEPMLLVAAVALTCVAWVEVNTIMFSSPEAVSPVQLADAPVYRVQLGDAGSVLLTKHGNRALQLLDPHSGELQERLDLPGGQLADAAISGTGRRVAFSSYTGELFVSDLSTGTVHSLSEERPEQCQHALSFSPDGRQLATGSARGVRLWQVDPLQFEPVWIDAEPCVGDLQFTADGRQVIIGALNGSLRVVDVETGRLIWHSPPQSGITACVASAAGGRYAALGTTDGGLHVWEPASGRRLWSRATDHLPVLCVSFSADDRILAAGSVNQQISLYRVSDGTLLGTLSGHTGPVRGLAHSPDGQRLYSAAYDGQVLVWDWPRMTLERRLPL